MLCHIHVNIENNHLYEISEFNLLVEHCLIYYSSGNKYFLQNKKVRLPTVQPAFKALILPTMSS